MIISHTYNMLLNFINYIYSDGFYSIKSLTFTTFVLFMSYELCKDWFSDIDAENDYFKDMPQGRIKPQCKDKENMQSDKKEIKEESLQLYKIFNHKK